MAPPASSLETLPLLVLERLSEYLNIDLDDRSGLWAFSLASSTCCAAAAAQRFCQIRLEGPFSNEVDSSLENCTKFLDPDARGRYVRRLKIGGGSIAETQRLNADIKDDEDAYKWNTDDCLDIHAFCRPFKSYVRSSRGAVTNCPEAWLALVRLIRQLPALEDFVWDLQSVMPRSVLSAVHERGCRLHMHHFRLPSMVQFRDNPHPIDADDYALASSPCLFSIIVRIVNFEDRGEVIYTYEAIQQMVAGVAPNLAHVWLVMSGGGDSIQLREAIRLGKPTRTDLFSGVVGIDRQPAKLGRLRSLVFSGCGVRTDEWRLYTDFTKLRRLTLVMSSRCVVTLADMASSGDFQSLDTLRLSSWEDVADEEIEALNRLLDSLPPLQRLDLSGHISNETFQTCLRRHGRNLRHLSLLPAQYYEESRIRPLNFTEALVRQLVEECPNLEQIKLSINRTQGNRQETGIYRALGRFPRLTRAFLCLKFSVGPNQELWDEERDGEHPLGGLEAEKVSPDFLRDAFINGAVDATLALSIFSLVSSGSRFNLRLETKMNSGRFRAVMPGGEGVFRDLIRWFNRSWVCERDFQGKVTAREMYSGETVEGGVEWQDLSEEIELYDGEEIYEKTFKEIWPQKTEQWWNDWEALPLCDE